MACSSSPPPPTAPLRQRPTRRPDPDARTRPPSSAAKGRELTDAEQILLQRTEQMLVEECMEEHGFPYWEGPIESVTARQRHGYVLDDVDWAAKYGYGGKFEEEAEKAGRNSPNDVYANALPEEDRIRGKALGGDLSADPLTVDLPAGGTVQTPGNGCRAEARERLYGDYPAWFRAMKTATSLTPLYVPDILLKDERLVRAVTAARKAAAKFSYDIGHAPWGVGRHCAGGPSGAQAAVLLIPGSRKVAGSRLRNSWRAGR